MSCPDCFSGHVHDGQPRGKTTKLYGLDAYVSEPPADRPVKGIIVIIPDAFGWEFVNNRILADHYAAKSDYKVYLPDFMHGTAAPLWLLDYMRPLLTPGTNIFKRMYSAFWAVCGFVPFIISNNPGKSYPKVKSWFEQLRKAEGDTLPIGAAGFCWGGKHTVLLAAGERIDGKLLIDAGFTAHPSMLNVPGDIEKMTLPVAFGLGDADSAVNAEVAAKIKDIVESRLPESARGEVVMYPGCGHGFAVRADISVNDANVATQALKAEDQCIAWFKKHFKDVA